MSDVARKLTSQEAHQLTLRIRQEAKATRDNLVMLHKLVDAAKRHEAWKLTGHASWPAYLADTLGGTLPLGPEQRQELMGYLLGEGMSTRAVAKATGVSQMTAVRAGHRAARVNQGGSPDAKVTARPATVTGLDGKSYKRSSSKAPAMPDKPTLLASSAAPTRPTLPEAVERLSNDLDALNARVAIMTGVLADAPPSSVMSLKEHAQDAITYLNRLLDVMAERESQPT